MSEVTAVELESVLVKCEAKGAPITTAIGQLRCWGRDAGFCKNVVDEDSFQRMVKLVLQLDTEGDTDVVISLYATISNILLARNQIAQALQAAALTEMVQKAVDLVQLLNMSHSYDEQLVALILPPIRLLYLVSVNEFARLSLEPALNDQILTLVRSQLQLIEKSSAVEPNQLILIDLVKIGYSMLHHDSKRFDPVFLTTVLDLVEKSDDSDVLLRQYANYMSFVPLHDLQQESSRIRASALHFVTALTNDVEALKESEIVTLLHFFNHLALLSELLYLEADKTVFEFLRTHFLPVDDGVASNTPPLYTALMKLLLKNNTDHSFGFGSSSDSGKQMVKNLTLDLYFKIMGNNIETFMNEIGLLLSMDFVKLKQGQPLKVFAQDDITKIKGTTGLYPAHYDVIEENKKEADDLPEWTTEEKEEEWEKLMDTFDKMKRNGMIKMVDNPLDALGKFDS